VAEECSRSNKKTFWMGSRGVKICTVHSFKGWESRFTIALLADTNHEETSAERLFYVALTRSREGVFMVNTSSRLSRGEIDWDPTPEFKSTGYSDFKLPTVRGGGQS
jgi:superfamily I DNA/RNA helicase